MTRLKRSGLPTAGELLNHLLESPKLLEAVRELPGPILGKLINSVGLEDAAELVALATTPQLESVFDEDLWQVEPGGWEEHFDPARFALWLHAFAEAGEAAVIRRLVELPLDFVILAVQRLILVVDIDSLALEMSNSGEDLDMLEKALDSCVYEEWEEFRLISREDSVWDVLNQALFSLDRDHHALLRQILERCAAMSSEWIEDNGGLYEVLTSDGMLESDVRAERDDRRARKGFVSPADARAFLELAGREKGAPTKRDPITSAYFRNLARTPDEAASPRKIRSDSATPDVAGLLKLLGESRSVEAMRPSRRLAAQRQRFGENVSESRQLGIPATPRRLDSTLAYLRDADPACYRTRIEEIAYLANVLMAAPQNYRERLRPVEALESALQTTDRGLELALGVAARSSYEDSLQAAATALKATTADCLFRQGFERALHVRKSR
jgi:hypothetical protein